MRIQESGTGISRKVENSIGNYARNWEFSVLNSHDNIIKTKHLTLAIIKEIFKSVPPHHKHPTTQPYVIFTYNNVGMITWEDFSPGAEFWKRRNWWKKMDPTVENPWDGIFKISKDVACVASASVLFLSAKKPIPEFWLSAKWVGSKRAEGSGSGGGREGSFRVQLKFANACYAGYLKKQQVWLAQDIAAHMRHKLDWIAARDHSGNEQLTSKCGKNKEVHLEGGE